MEHFGEHLINIANNVSLIGPIHCVGCSKEEIQALMQAQGISQLPRLYREYLEVMGKSGILSNIYPGSDWSYQRLLRIKQDWQDEIVREKVTFIIPEKAFVFFQHGGYEYRYFMTDTDYDDDGDCLTYLSLEEETEQGYNISVDGTIREYLEYHAKLLGKPVNLKIPNYTDNKEG